MIYEYALGGNEVAPYTVTKHAQIHSFCCSPYGRYDIRDTDEHGRSCLIWAEHAVNYARRPNVSLIPRTSSTSLSAESSAGPCLSSSPLGNAPSPPSRSASRPGSRSIPIRTRTLYPGSSRTARGSRRSSASSLSTIRRRRWSRLLRRRGDSSC
jgi:hypothetical protein